MIYIVEFFGVWKNLCACHDSWVTHQ